VAGLAGLIIRGRKVSGQVAVPVPAAGSVGSDHLVPAEMKPLCVCVTLSGNRWRKILSEPPIPRSFLTIPFNECVPIITIHSNSSRAAG